MMCGCLCGRELENSHTRIPLTLLNALVNVQLHILSDPEVFSCGTQQQWSSFGGKLSMQLSFLILERQCVQYGGDWTHCCSVQLTPLPITYVHKLDMKSREFQNKKSVIFLIYFLRGGFYTCWVKLVLDL